MENTVIPKLSKRFRNALEFASTLHARQVRKGSSVPYISHLLSVAALVLEDGGSENEAVAALLHDAIEDQGKRKGVERLKRDIRQQFGKAVLEIVEGCTDGDRINDPPWRERKEHYLAHLKEASPMVRRIATADKLHNARCLLMDYRKQGDRLWKRFNAEKEDILWYYRSMADELSQLDSIGIAGELRRVVAELERLAGKNWGRS
jgi:(p)ppGpp synthase/HD superfamily hydrolase